MLLRAFVATRLHPLVLVASFAAYVTGSSGLEAQSTVAGPDLIVAVPAEFLTTIIDGVVPAINRRINNATLPTCCYDDVGMKNVHLNFESLQMSGSNAVIGIGASAQEVVMTVGINFTLTGDYRLCVHALHQGYDRPATSCDTIKGCKGAFSIAPRVRLQVALGFNASVGGGP
jgi:hypothetical protein